MDNEALYKLITELHESTQRDFAELRESTQRGFADISVKLDQVVTAQKRHSQLFTSNAFALAGRSPLSKRFGTM